jgi:peroxiredoxin
MIFTFFLARKLPGTIAAPQIGQRVPDFTLTDANGQSVSLDSLFTPASGEPQSAAPKAVLLIFYRGYW